MTAFVTVVVVLVAVVCVVVALQLLGAITWPARYFMRRRK